MWIRTLEADKMSGETTGFIMKLAQNPLEMS